MADRRLLKALGVKCSYHPNVETALRCSRCEKPICPKCMIQTPVGARCPECAHMRRLPIYEVSGGYYVRAIGTGLAVAAAAGLVWALLNLAIGGIFSLLIGIGTGYVIGEVISRAVNRKRSGGLQLVAGLSVVLAFLLRSFFLILFLSSSDGSGIIASLEAAITVTVNTVSNLYGLLALGIAIYLAVMRVR